MTEREKLVLEMPGAAPRRLLGFLTAAALLMGALSFASRCYVHAHVGAFGKLGAFLVNLVNVDSEQSLPAWYSAGLLLVAGLSSGLVPTLRQTPSQPRALYWRVLGVALCGMSLDEYVEVHERAGHVLQDAWQLGGVLFFAWVIPGAALVVGFGLGMIPFLRGVPRRFRRLFIAAGLTYVAGAVGMELVSGMYAALYGQQALGFDALSTVEEFLEMMGVSLMLYALAEYTRTPMERSPSSA